MSLVKCGDVVTLVLFVFKVSKLKSQEEYYLRLLVIHVLEGRKWFKTGQPELWNEDRYKEVEDDILCNIKKHKPCLHIDYEELQNFNIIESDDKEDASEFWMINHDLLHQDLEDGDQGLF